MHGIVDGYNTGIVLIESKIECRGYVNLAHQFFYLVKFMRVKFNQKLFDSQKHFVSKQKITSWSVVADSTVMFNHKMNNTIFFIRIVLSFLGICPEFNYRK